MHRRDAMRVTLVLLFACAACDISPDVEIDFGGGGTSCLIDSWGSGCGTGGVISWPTPPQAQSCLRPRRCEPPTDDERAVLCLEVLDAETQQPPASTDVGYHLRIGIADPATFVPRVLVGNACSGDAFPSFVPPDSGVVNVTVTTDGADGHFGSAVTQVAVAKGKAIKVPVYVFRNRTLSTWLTAAGFGSGAISVGGLFLDLFIDTGAEPPPGYPYPGAPVAGLPILDPKRSVAFTGTGTSGLTTLDPALASTDSPGAALSTGATTAVGTAGCSFDEPLPWKSAGTVVVRPHLGTCGP